jgi:hypothetical protein
MYKLCQKLIHTTNPAISTYCMRPENHTGKCSPDATEEDKKETTSNGKTM